MLTLSWLIILITFPNYFCWTITLSEFSGSQIRLFRFLEDQPLSPVLSPSLPFDFIFYPHCTPCTSTRPKGRDVKRKQRPPKQLMCHVLL